MELSAPNCWTVWPYAGLVGQVSYVSKCQSYRFMSMNLVVTTLHVLSPSKMTLSRPSERKQDADYSK